MLFGSFLWPHRHHATAALTRLAPMPAGIKRQRTRPEKRFGAARQMQASAARSLQRFSSMSPRIKSLGTNTLERVGVARAGVGCS